MQFGIPRADGVTFLAFEEGGAVELVCLADDARWTFPDMQTASKHAQSYMPVARAVEKPPVRQPPVSRQWARRQ